MIRNIRKYCIISRLLFCMLLMITAFTACTKDNELATAMDNHEYAYVYQDIDIPSVEGKVICSYFDKNYYIVTAQEDKTYLNIYDSASNENRTISLKLGDKERIRTLIVKDKIIAITEDEGDIYYIVVIEEDGSESERVLLEGVDEYGFNRLIADDEGRIYFSNSTDIQVYDKNLRFLGRIDGEDRIISIAVGNSEIIRAIIQKGDDSYIGAADYWLCSIDINQMKIKKEMKLSKEPADGKVMLDTNKYDACIRMDDGLYIVKSGKLQKEFDYNCSYVTQMESNNLINTGEQEFALVVSEKGKCIIRKYSRANENVFEKKTIITLGCFGDSSQLSQTVVDFNKNSDKYFVEIVDYGIDKNGAARFNLELTDGRGPDVFCLGGYQSLDNLRIKGMCENLNTYIENDEEIKKSDLIDSYVNAIDYNGATYMVTDSFTIETLVTRKNEYLSDYNCSYDEFAGYIGNAGENVALTYPNLPRMDMFVAFSELSLRYCIDYDKAKCDFEIPEIKNLMKLCYDEGIDTMEFDMSELTESDFINAYKNGEALFLTSPTLGSMKRIEEIFGDDICFCGYPGAGCFFRPTKEICMNANSKNKDIAWEFIRIFLTEEHQAQIAAEDGDVIPTRKDSYEALKVRLTAKEDFTDAYGNEIKALEEIVDTEYIKYYDNLIEHTDKYIDLNFYLEEILYDEAAAYFNDEHDLDTTVELMENRVNTYLKEQR